MESELSDKVYDVKEVLPDISISTIGELMTLANYDWKLVMSCRDLPNDIDEYRAHIINERLRRMEARLEGVTMSGWKLNEYLEEPKKTDEGLTGYQVERRLKSIDQTIRETNAQVSDMMDKVIDMRIDVLVDLKETKTTLDKLNRFMTFSMGVISLLLAVLTFVLIAVLQLS